MREPEKSGADSRILLLAPTEKDAMAGRTALAQAGMDCRLCTSLAEVTAEIPRGAGAVIVPQEAVLNDGTLLFSETLRQQPRWSSLPVLVLTSARRLPMKKLRALIEIGDISLLKRPLDLTEFVNAVRAALRDRLRQYQVRDYIAEHARQAEALREADRRKDEFLAMLAHELRNPLAPIRNGLQILQLASQDSDAVAQTREMMNRQVQHLTRLVDDLLDVSRITRGKVALRKQDIDLNEVMIRAIETVRPFIDERKHKLTVSQPGRAVWVHADLTRMTQVVGNLLHNASKYSEAQSPIALILEHEGEQALIRVQDQGVGISEEMLAHVFEPFTQIDRSIDRSEGGLGLGLALVRSLVELHGGSVQAQSGGIGKGSEFIVRLPALSSDSVRRLESRPKAASPKSQPRRILIVDDNIDAGDSLAVLLRLTGHEVSVARNGTRAIELVHDLQPDVGILDIGLPGMDGYELARRLRNEPHGRSMLLIAITGYGQEDDRKRAKQAGFNHHLTKPADPVQLAHLLARNVANGSTKR
jgi:signal transduction histidine kinase/ActR/RegA family two-component response regulator